MSDVQKGRGATYVDLSILPDMLRKGLFLPDVFEIVEVKYASHDRLILFLESASIPTVSDGEPIPEVSLRYIREEDRVFLDCVELSGYGYIDARMVKISVGGVIYQREQTSKSEPLTNECAATILREYTGKVI